MFLRRAGVLEDRRDGPRVYYRVRNARVFEILDVLNALVGAGIHLANAPVVSDCACPRCQRAERKPGVNSRQRNTNGNH